MLSEVPSQEPQNPYSNLRANGNPQPSFLSSAIKKPTGRYVENKAGFKKKGKSSLLQSRFKPTDRRKLHSRHQHVQCGTVFLKPSTVGRFLPLKRLSLIFREINAFKTY